MRRAIFAALAAIMLGNAPGSPVVNPAHAEMAMYYEVTGVSDDDMLKMRAGAGTGYRVIAGFPNGTVFRVHSCEQTGSTRWCRVSLRQARGLKGFVSWAYLKEHKSGS
ncbi:SH3 domain-containing protein [Pseudotabrizicola alkalilacus]|uniref:SH3 domain-containing protein n=1 Tax=Pseudotabrizicola alkalilacus TaxID=2305252 RepID=A0A411Z051_9RHOB|nr:SH3 domain-containing protein [Pseudotabrizicola alkalilacus]RGP36432.1 SH3 domain-containing protein [Pseudotabrizicola alkalilacus]